jgi:hypothetical protein
VILHSTFSSFMSNLLERQMISRHKGCSSCLNLLGTSQRATIVVVTMPTAILNTFLYHSLDKTWHSLWTHSLLLDSSHNWYL